MWCDYYPEVDFISNNSIEEINSPALKIFYELTSTMYFLLIYI